MGKLSHPLFGVVDPGDSSWRTTVRYAQRSVDVDLEMDPGAVTETQLNRTIGLIDDLAALDRQARTALAENDEQMEMYRRHHLEQLDAQTGDTARRWWAISQPKTSVSPPGTANWLIVAARRHLALAFRGSREINGPSQCFG